MTWLSLYNRVHHFRVEKILTKQFDSYWSTPMRIAPSAVVKLSHMVHPRKLKTMSGLVLAPWLVDEGQQTAAHELPDIFVRNCAVYVFKNENLIKGITYGEKSLGYVMPTETSIDINDWIDFEFAAYLYSCAESAKQHERNHRS